MSRATLLLGLTPVATTFNKQPHLVLCLLPIKIPRFRMGLPRAMVYRAQHVPCSFPGSLGTELSVNGSYLELCIMAVLGSPLQRSVSGTRVLGAYTVLPSHTPIMKDEGSQAWGCIWVVSCRIFLLSVQQKV